MKRKWYLFIILLLMYAALFIFLIRTEWNQPRLTDVSMTDQVSGYNGTGQEWDKIKEPSSYGVFSWNEAVLTMEEPEKLLQEYGITEIYQSIPLSSLMNHAQEVPLFLDRMEQAGVSVYYLAGDSSYGITGGLKSIYEHIDALAAANSKLKEDGNAEFAGIVMDVEPYLTDPWKNASEEEQRELFREYTDIMCNAYAYAIEKQLPFYPCIPYFYEKYNAQELTRLFREGGDGFLIMNYNRNDEYGQLLTEVLLAEKNNKPIICIFELQPAGTHDLSEWNTYYQDGIEAVKAASAALYDEFEYQKLHFAYHYYDILAEW